MFFFFFFFFFFALCLRVSRAMLAIRQALKFFSRHCDTHARTHAHPSEKKTIHITNTEKESPTIATLEAASGGDRRRRRRPRTTTATEDDDGDRGRRRRPRTTTATEDDDDDDRTRRSPLAHFACAVIRKFPHCPSHRASWNCVQAFIANCCLPRQ